MARPIVGTALVHKRQHPFGTIGSPGREKAVLLKVKRPTAMNCNKALVSHMYVTGERVDASSVLSATP